LGADTEAGRQELTRHLEARRWEEEDVEASRRIRRGWCFGGNEFWQGLLEQVDQQRGPNHLGQEWQESQVAKAERLVQAALASRGWTEEDLAGRPKTDPVKLEIARQLRKESTMTIPWTAQRLQMGSANTLRNRLHLTLKRQLHHRFVWNLLSVSEFQLLRSSPFGLQPSFHQVVAIQ
jgi:hypothetical protein